MPGHRDSGQDRGRPKGGLAQLINRTLDIKVTTINCDNFRLQAQLIVFPNITLLWINVYFPTDSQNLNADTTELVTTLKAIETIMDTCNFSDVLIQGDFNWDNKRDSGHSMVMRDFTDRIGLKSVWEKFPVGFTHIHTDMKSTSVLDNFLCNEGLLDYISDAGVMHLGDNLSRHSPIMVKLCVGDIPFKQPSVSLPQPRRPAWYKATSENIAEYTELVQERLENLSCPDSLFCTD